MTKMKVTTEGERVIDRLWDVIAAKGFEKDTYFEQAAMDIRALPKLEGTVHVNMALVLKFLPQYLLNVSDVPEVGRRLDAGRRRVPVPPGAGPRARRDRLRRLAHGVRRVRRRAQRRGLPRAGRGPGDARDHGRARTPSRRKDLGLLLVLGELFTLRRLRAAGAGAGRADRRRPASRRPGLRRARARLLRLRRRPARQGVGEQGAAVVGAGPRARARRRPGPLRARVAAGARPRGVYEMRP